MHAQNRRPFVVPEAVPWTVLLDNLDLYWRKHCEDENSIDHSSNGGIGLTRESRNYLTAKLFGKLST